MLVRWVASSLRPSLERIHQIGARNHSSPYIFMAGVQLSSPHHVLPTTAKNESPPSFLLVSAGGTPAPPGSVPAYKNFLGPSVLPSQF